MPTIKLGKYEISRLVLGSNPLAGASHFNPILDALMKEWMTPEKVMEILKRCEKAGISGWQLHTAPNLSALLPKYLAEGGKMTSFSLSDFKDPIQSIQDVKKMGALGIVHHGEQTDNKLRDKKMDDVHDFLKAARDSGLLVGVSMHNPASMDYIEGKGWDVDFYMTCVYRRNRPVEEQRELFKEAVMGEPYFEGDPARMCKMIRQTKRTCFAFKILAAGRNVKSPQAVEGAFKFVLENIKPQDGVIVGMFPKFTDEITKNANLTRKFGQNKA